MFWIGRGRKLLLSGESSSSGVLTSSCFSKTSTVASLTKSVAKLHLNSVEQPQIAEIAGVTSLLVPEGA